MVQLIADSGATKCEWCLLTGSTQQTVLTPGISPYFLDTNGIVQILREQLLPYVGSQVDVVHFYGTGLGNKANVPIVESALQTVFPTAIINTETDILAAARALCGTQPGMACILGTGSNACFYDGKEIRKSNPGLGFILGDEGSGAYLGKKVLQHYLYNTFDDDLTASFRAHYSVTDAEILNKVYKEAFPNRYLASFAEFLSKYRGHYMIENILEDGLNDFVFNHLYKFAESWTMPINFVGSIAHHFSDVLAELCSAAEIELGKVLKSPMPGLVDYHKQG